MKRALWLVVVLAGLLGGLCYGRSGSSGGSVGVRGYTRSDGTYVSPYTRSAPNGMKLDNYSAPGNVNPHKGAVGKGTTDELSPRLPNVPQYQRKSFLTAPSTPRYEVPEVKVEPSPRSNFGWTPVQRDSRGRIKRSDAAKHEFMRQTGYPNGRPGYVVDHIVPLKRGGADAPSNMQWQTAAEAKVKDRVE